MELSPRKLLYIMSPSYSGSTLLTILLGEHPAIATIGELKASAFGDIHHYRCSCGERLLECPFWLEVAKRIEAGGGRFSLTHWDTHFTDTRPVYRKLLQSTVRGPLFETVRNTLIALVPGTAARKKRIIENNRAVIDTVCNITQRQIFLDGSKDPVRAKHMIDSGLWDISIICLIRDGRGTANSHKTHMKTGIDAAAKEWRHKMTEIKAFLDTVPTSRKMVVHYEQLCKSPQKVLDDICDFANLPRFTPVGHSQSTQNRHILGNDMRLKLINEIKLDEKWRSALSSDELNRFDSISGPLNKEFGYG